MTCDVCGTEENVNCEMMMKGEQVDRIYHLCAYHWMVVFRDCLEDFLEQNEYKVNSYIKATADKMIVDTHARTKMEAIADEEGNVDLNEFEPEMVRTLRPYEGDEYEEIEE
jgi:hypothetical protein